MNYKLNLIDSAQAILTAQEFLLREIEAWDLTKEQRRKINDILEDANNMEFHLMQLKDSFKK